MNHEDSLWEGKQKERETVKEQVKMKKKYGVPMLNIVNVEVERPMMSESQGEWVESKKNYQAFEDDEEVPSAAPKKFWDDED